MNNNRVLKNFTCIFLFIIYIAVYRLFIVTNLLRYSEFVTASFLLIITFIAIMFFGFRKDKITPLKKNIYAITIVQILLFFTISYGLGLLVGFLKNSYSLTPYSIINNIFAPIIILTCIEIYRYVVLNGNSSSKKSMYLITFVLILFELAINISTTTVFNFSEIFKLVTTIVIPIIIKNCVFSYLTVNVGYRPALIYRLVMDLYVFVIPIVPNLGEYLHSMIGILLPFVLYLYCSRAINEHYNGVEFEVQKSIFKWVDIPIIAFILIVVSLVSGIFPFYLVGIATGSMTPKINKGDAVFVHKIKKSQDIKIGDVIVYTDSGKNIVHRLVRIEKKKKKRYYITKGDANNTEDKVLIKFKDIKGVVIFKIPAIAYPSILIEEKLK
ncbi:MAG: signal peptidase I [Bacilli bacterium]|nr:signal peptidase I [Bacilli bacterium]